MLPRLAAQLFTNIFMPGVPEVDKLAAADPNGVGIAQIGRGPLACHIVYISPKGTPEQIAARLKLIMELPSADARCVYDHFAFLTGGEPFLSLNNERGVHIRKTRIVPYLNPKNFYTDSAEQLQKFFALLAKHAGQQIEVTNLIKDHILDFFCQTLFGARMDEQTKHSLSSIESSKLPVIFCLAPQFIIKLLPYIPSIKRQRDEYEHVIKHFITQNLQKFRSEDMLPGRRNWWQDVVADRYQKNLRELTDQDIEMLACDPELRISIGIILGVRNLGDVLAQIMVSVFEKPGNASLKQFREELCAQIKKQPKENGFVRQCDLYNHSKMPLLQAAYLEALRLSSHSLDIARYSPTPIAQEGLNIPAQSLIVFKFHAMKECLASAEFPPDQFAPQRFLDPQGQLREEAKLHQGLLTPFGIGARKCPASQLAELICKIYLIAGLEQNLHFYAKKEVAVSSKNLFTTETLAPAADRASSRADRPSPSH